jgi:predicted 2-oxoglutarate/Fe(II)-dependent dioxygenase YbiX
LPPAGFFTRFGIFAQEGFLEATACRELATEMLSSEGAPATVSLSAEHIDVDYRRTTMVQVSDETRRSLEVRFRDLKPALEDHFAEKLGEMERTQFLVYREGDHFRRHRDSPPEPKSGPADSVRQISLIVFVNAPNRDGEGAAYGGGQLTFYGLLGDQKGEGVGLPLDPVAGLLVAFRSELVHSVTPVTHGERCTVVSWFTS